MLCAPASSTPASTTPHVKEFKPQTLASRKKHNTSTNKGSKGCNIANGGVSAGQIYIQDAKLAEAQMT
jgi:hypothetical protein